MHISVKTVIQYGIYSRQQLINTINTLLELYSNIYRCMLILPNLLHESQFSH